MSKFYNMTVNNAGLSEALALLSVHSFEPHDQQISLSMKAGCAIGRFQRLFRKR